MDFDMLFVTRLLFYFRAEGYLGVLIIKKTEHMGYFRSFRVWGLKATAVKLPNPMQFNAEPWNPTTKRKPEQLLDFSPVYSVYSFSRIHLKTLFQSSSSLPQPPTPTRRP